MDQENQSADIVDFDDVALAELIRKVGDGDSAAFANLYNSTSSLIFGLVLRFLPDKTVAEETLLDIYTHIWKESAKYSPENFMPLEWMITIARTRAIFKLDSTRESRKRKITEIEETDSPTTVAPSIQNRARSGMDTLTSSQREALDWAFYTGLSSSEIAVHCGKPSGAIRTHTRIGMSKLYDLFRPLYERGTGPESEEGRQNIDS